MRARFIIASALLLSLWACQEGDGRPPLRAKVIERQDELIGGPTAKGKLGDLLIENDEIRVIIAGVGPSYTAGIFGGSVVDVDKHRWRGGVRQGHGYDHFAETFPLANLLVPNPAQPPWGLEFNPEGFNIRPQAAVVQVIKDGSDGEAIVRVEGHSGYMFDTLKFINQDFIRGFLADGKFGSVELQFGMIYGLAKTLLGVDLLALLNRLQFEFDFQTDYSLRQGEPYLTMRTTIKLSPPSDKRMAECPPIPCELACAHGYVMEERVQALDAYAIEGPNVCPICACADTQPAMPVFTESANFFEVMLGKLERWQDPAWKGGVVAGDFLFFGGDAEIFSPGLGFDYDAKIFNNMWQGVGTMGSPFTFDWIAARGDNVSYAVTSVNPDKKAGFDCPAHRLEITRVDPAGQAALAEALAEHYGDLYNPQLAASAARTLVVDRKPIPLMEIPTGVGGDYAAWVASTLTGPEATAARQQLGEVDLALPIAPACRPAKVLLPLFSTSATATLSHYSDGVELVADGDAWRDQVRSFTFERYLIVGDGDIGDVLKVVYDLKDTAHGQVKGLVLAEGSLDPVHHADVFAFRDPRPSAADPLPAGFAEFKAMALDAFGDLGFVSQMQSDLGLDPVADGDYSGPLPPGRYLLAAHRREAGTSPFVAVEIKANQVEIAHLVLPQPGEVEYRIVDEGGVGIPASVSFVALDDADRPMRWEGINEPSMGDPRYEHGVFTQSFTLDGEGSALLPAGRYAAHASRGIEYSHAEQIIEVKAGQATPMMATLIREVDTRGYISGDFHIHQSPSTDAGLDLFTRLANAAAVGLEMMIATDHDHVTDYMPYILEMGLQRFISTQIGVETSPLEYGHTNAWPLRYDARQGHTHDPPPWAGRTVGQLWGEMRARATGDPEAFVLQTNHTRDGFLGYFDQIGLKGYNLERKTPGMEMCSAVMEQAPCDFNAMELLNGKHLEFLWTPTIGEARDFNRCSQEIIAASAPQAVGEACAALRQGPEGCEGAALAAQEAGLEERERIKRLRHRDHCGWHDLFRQEMTDARALPLLDAKRYALEALKNLNIRYLLERTPEELAAYRATTFETDLGCDFDAAFQGCAPLQDEDGVYEAGCGGEDCFCETCVCARHPECCLAPDEGGVGWTDACAASCQLECGGCGVQPCTDRQKSLDDWFAFLNAGFNVTGTACSDSHSTNNQVGLPRTFVATQTDRPEAIDARDFNKNLIAHKAIISTGPFIDFQIETPRGIAEVGETIVSARGRVEARIKIQTPSWFRVDRVEIYRNGLQERVLFIEPEGGDVEAQRRKIIDFNAQIGLGNPEEDSWYVVMTYGVNDRAPMAPVFKRAPLGHILLTTVISLAGEQIMGIFGEVLDKIPAAVLGGLGDINSLLAPLELPDSTDVLPFALTNPIWVDVDGDGFNAPEAVDKDGDGRADLPPFCAVPCAPMPDDEGNDTQGSCGANQICMTDAATGLGRCGAPIPKHCVGLQPVGGPHIH
ncbi:hypothetical protein KKB55_01685 [Myxococcota bacterium]|nr:hypothetical protein [Myxococcota bacterium]MBU1896464.1 hypothetical protein [Myxococcota bacterium]